MQYETYKLYCLSVEEVFSEEGGKAQEMGRKQLFKLVFLLIGIALVVNVLFFLNFNRAFVHNELIALDLLPKPETMTELYFTNNVNLPSTVTGNQTISFSFVIHNLEMTDYQYVYNVSVNVNGTKHVVDSGRVLVKNDQYYVKNEKFELTSSPGKQEVVVELTNMQQSIDFWVGDSK
jgi:hypothetical protein